MISKKIDPKKLDDFNRIVGDIWDIATKLTTMYNSFSEQEKVLAGGLLIQAKVPWSGKKISGLIGERDYIARLVQQAVDELQRPPVPPQPEVFKEDKNTTLN